MKVSIRRSVDLFEDEGQVSPRRLPDHVQLFSRAFLLLSSSEICMDGRNWFSAGAGTVFANEAGQPFSMRCTSKPLFTVWCHVEEAA
ncbi:hypothetical protein [Rhizobium sp. LEGMi135b]